MERRTSFSKRIFCIMLSLLMVLSMMLYFPSGIFSNISFGLKASAEEITLTEPQKDGNGVYQIGTAEELYWFAACVNGTDGVTQNKSANAVLTADITVNTGDVAGCSGKKAEGWKDWTPIGNYDNHYTGTFDGKNHTISGLYFNNTSTDYVGLFGFVGILEWIYGGGGYDTVDGVIENVGVINSYFNANRNVGGVCGELEAGTIEKCYYTGNVNGTGWYVGGVCGHIYNGGTITSCYNTGTVKVTGESGAVGGVCGINYGTITDCYNTGTVSGSEYVGGVCGENEEGTITNCYNMGNVSGSSCVGGVCGLNKSLIANCYNIGTVSATSNVGVVGGVCGTNYEGSITNCYNIGTVSATGRSSVVGGVCGENSSTITSCYNTGTVIATCEMSIVGGVCGINYGTITNCYNTGEVSATGEDSFVGGVCGENNATITNCYYLEECNAENTTFNCLVGESKTTAEFSDGTVCGLVGYHSQFENGFCGLCGGYEPANLTTDKYDIDGDTIKDTVYEIGNAGQLYWFAALVNGTLSDVDQNRSANAKLMNDITVNDNLLSSLEYDEEGNVTNGASFSKWTPIGNQDYYYKGTFDGNGKTVSGLFFDSSTEKYIGLFGYIDSGKVTDVKVADSYIRGYVEVGGVCGMNYSGEISGCSNKGTIRGSSGVGGVCGNNTSSAKDITNCNNEGTVIGIEQNTGGVCGYNASGCSNCYNRGNVSGVLLVGGVCGYVGKNISDCYNAGYVSGTDYYIGGICGSLSGELTNCYNIGQISGTGSNVGGVCGKNYGTITNSLNISDVSAKGYAGGVCGYNDGVIRNTCHTGNARSTSSVMGGVCGYNAGTVVNSYSRGDVYAKYSEGGVCGKNAGTIANCYFSSSEYSGNAIGTDESSSTVNVMGKSDEELSNGEVAYLLSQGCTVGEGESAVTHDGSVWGQNLETDSYPALGGDKVYCNKSYVDCVDSNNVTYTYSNTEEDVHVDHVFDNGKCQYCGKILPQAPQQDSEGVYQITNAAELYWFAGLVNGTLDGVTKNNSANAKLMNDITVNEDLLASLEYDSEGNVTNGTSITKWTPIGISDRYRYNGTFDGNGKTVSGLFYDSSTTDYVGLFGYIGSGKVTGVKVADSYIRGKNYVGGVCGRNESGEITDCGNSGTVVGTEVVGGVCGNNYETAKDITDCYNEGTVIGTDQYTGGVCGYNHASCSGCYNTGNVSGDWSVGGVCGVVHGEVINCYNTGDISATGSNVGGVCGNTNRADAKITNCYNTGNVTSTVEDNWYIGGVCGNLWGEMTGCYNTGKVSTTGTEVGGVCGYISGTVKNCYNLGDVSGNMNIGGVCGLTESGMTVNCYSLGSVSGSSNVGGVCGYNCGAIANCYFNSTKFIGNAIGDDFSGNSVNVSGRAEESFASGEVAYLLVQGYTAGEGESAVVYDGSVWGQTFGTDNYPVIGGNKVYQNESYSGCVDAPGDVIYVYANSEAEPAYKDHEYICGLCKYCEISVQKVEGVYQITNAAELYWFADYVNSGNTDADAKLMNNITVNNDLLASLEYDEDGNVTNGASFTSWTPIGWYDYNTGDYYAYTGTFDGQGFTVSGLYFNDPNGDDVGLFGDNYGTVKNVGVVDSYFNGDEYIGGVCGYFDDGSIINCYFTGVIDGNDYVGGVCGYSGGEITNCYNAGAVTATGEEAYVGGVCGVNDSGTIANCYYDITVFSGNAVGYSVGTVMEIALGKTTTQLGSGEVAYLLSLGCTIAEGEETKTYDGSVWGQDLGTDGDEYPVLNGKEVLTNVDKSQFANDIIIYGQSASLDGTIGFNIYVSADDSYDWDKTIGGVTGVKNEDGLYVFTYNVAAKDMDNEIQFTVNDKIDVTVSVSKYLDELGETDNESLKNLADSMSDYGDAAKAFFSSGTVAEQTVTDDLSVYNFTVGTMPEGISYYGSSLLLKFETTVRHYFKLADGKSIGDFAFTVDGVTAEPTEKQGYYYIDIENISADKLGTGFTVSINGEDVITNYSALSYVYKVLDSDSTDDNLKNLVKALYLYNNAAIAYMN